SRLYEQLQSARDELLKPPLINYTDLHPAVRAKKDQIKALEQQLAEANKPAAQPITDNKSKEEDSEVLRHQLTTMTANRVVLANRQREAQMYVDNPPGYCKVFAPSTQKDLIVKKAQPRVIFVSVAAGLLGFFGSLFLVLLAELLDTR